MTKLNKTGEDEMKYRVKLMFQYSDVVHVEANSEKEAIALALEDCHEDYEMFMDTEVTTEDDS
jgi:hypothetical protein